MSGSQNGFRLAGANLPKRRDEIVAAASPRSADNFSGSIVVPEARDRLFEVIERLQMPDEVRGTLDGTITGDMRLQQMLFQAMIDTWPRLQKCLAEVKRQVRKAPWKVVPWSLRGEKPKAKAERLAKDVENAIWSMRPDPITGLKGFEGTAEELAMGYFLGHQVMEIHWNRGPNGWMPKATKTLSPRFYGYPYDIEGPDRLMLDKTGGKSGTHALEDFPPNRFLVAVNGVHSGHATVAAPLRALTGYWLAAVFGLKWFMSYAQLFGQPIRWAEYVAGDAKAKAEIQNMMQNIGSSAWGVFPAGTKLNFEESGKSASTLPQRELLNLADEQCDVFILGQTLTSSQGDKGSQALGTVHMEVRDDVIAGICDFVGEIFTHQLAPAIVAVNYGERTDVPSVWAVYEEPKDEQALAERDEKLGITSGDTPVEKAWFYERHGIPLPAAGAELFKEKPDPKQVIDPKTGLPVPPVPGEEVPPGDDKPKKEDEKPEPKEKPKIEAAAADREIPTVDKLSNAVIAGLTGVRAEWLSPLRPTFERIIALASDPNVSEETLQAELAEIQRQMPELYDLMGTERLQKAFEEAIGSAMLAGSVQRYET